MAADTVAPRRIAHNPGRAAAVTPNDSVDLPNPAERLWIGTLGDVEVVPFGQDSSVTYLNVPSGTYINLRVSRVRAAGTNASDIIAEFF